MNTNEHESVWLERWNRHSCLFSATSGTDRQECLSHLGLILNVKHATLE